MTKYLLISVRSEWIYHILSGNKKLELRKKILKWVLEEIAKGETVKCLLYCTKALPYLAFDFNDYEVNGYPEPHCGYELYETKLALDFRNLDDLPLNGKIIGEFDLNKVEEITIDSYQCPYVIDDFDYDAKTDTLNYNDLLEMSEVAEIDFVNYEPKYAMYIDNLKMFDKPKNLSDYYKSNYYGSEVLEPHICKFSSVDDNDFKECLKDFKLTKAPQNMMTVWGIDE